MVENIIQMAFESGIWAALFCFLFLYQLKDSREREKKYTDTLNTLAESTRDIASIKDDADKIIVSQAKIKENTAKIIDDTDVIKGVIDKIRDDTDDILDKIMVMEAIK